eukprot:TRINITY_DN3494_c0_g2_i8.p1 TRINITY_DN3494_c0_g2~~TRINITY_DN3494_c0_g2_i8.p1  ORF type:complete len:153 (+),score=33.68 TRINITY_DN3494_c0_g2_i8:84-542(+)
MTDQKFSRHLPFTFLKEVSQEFLRRYPDLDSVSSFEDLPAYLAERMEFYNQKEKDSEKGGEKIREIRSQLNEVKDVMKSSLEKALERGEKIEVLVDRTADLSTHANTFRISGRNLSRKMCWQNAKIYICVIIAILVVGLIAFYTFCNNCLHS